MKYSLTYYLLICCLIIPTAITAGIIQDLDGYIKDLRASIVQINESKTMLKEQLYTQLKTQIIDAANTSLDNDINPNAKILSDTHKMLLDYKKYLDLAPIAGIKQLPDVIWGAMQVLGQAQGAVMGLRNTFEPLVAAFNPTNDPHKIYADLTTSETELNKAINNLIEIQTSLKALQQ